MHHVFTHFVDAHVAYERERVRGCLTGSKLKHKWNRTISLLIVSMVTLNECGTICQFSISFVRQHIALSDIVSVRAYNSETSAAAFTFSAY